MHGFGNLAGNLCLTLGIAIALVLIAFVSGVQSGKHRVLDIFWGLGFVIISIAGLWLTTDRGTSQIKLLATALTAVWGVRLTAHLAWRSRGKGEDARYEALLAGARGNRDWYAFRVVYLPQGLALWFISWPVQVAQYVGGALTAAPFAGLVIWVIGMLFESVADAQLVRFTSDPANKRKVLDTGLWRYSRHPNYFGDCCVWWGIWMLGTHTWAGLATIASPFTMSYLLIRKTGKPLLEDHLMETRTNYAEYIDRTSGFFPKAPRRASGS